MSSDVADILLTSLRAELLHGGLDVPVSVTIGLLQARDELYAERAIDACLARGATITEIIRAAAGELERRGNPLRADPLEGLTEDEHDHVYQSEEAGEARSTLGASEPSMAVIVVSMLATVLRMAGLDGLLDEARARMISQGLDPRVTNASSVMTELEMHEFFRTRLYAEDEKRGGE